MTDIIGKIYSIPDENNIKFYSVMMKFDKCRFKDWAIEDIDLLKYNIGKYLDYVNSSEFFCSYDEIDLKSYILYTLCKLGLNYNRFDCMRKYLTLLSMLSDTSEEIFILMNKNYSTFKEKTKNF